MYYKILILLFPLRLLAYSYSLISEGSIEIHVLTVDPREHCIVPAKAIGRQTVRKLALDYGATLAVNGGFWKSDGTPAGILKIDHKWHGFSEKQRGAVGWSSCGKRVLFDRISITGTTHTNFTHSKEWHSLEHIVGGTPLLIIRGEVIRDFTPEKTLKSFLVKKYSRTAVGVKDNGEWVFVMVKGGLFGGMTIVEIAEFMFQLGCVAALNLDGGSSSTMVVEDAVYTGSFFEAAVSDAILIF